MLSSKMKQDPIRDMESKTTLAVREGSGARRRTEDGERRTGKDGESVTVEGARLVAARRLEVDDDDSVMSILTNSSVDPHGLKDGGVHGVGICTRATPGSARRLPPFHAVPASLGLLQPTLPVHVQPGEANRDLLLDAHRVAEPCLIPCWLSSTPAAAQTVSKCGI